MSDPARAYRRWLRRRLAILIPLLGAALAASLLIAFGPDSGGWLNVLTLVLCATCLSTLGYITVQTLACASLHSRGERRRARALREQISAHGRLATVCFLVLAGLAAAPLLLRRPPDDPETYVHRHPRIPLAAPLPGLPPAPAPAPEPAVAEAPAPAPQPQVLPVMADLPRRLEIQERELELPIASAPFPEPPPAPAPTPESELPIFRPELLTTDALRLLRSADAPGVDRPGLPESRDDVPPPSIRTEILLLSLEGHGRGGAARAEIDYPLGPAGSLRAEIFGAVFGSGSSLEEFEAEWGWNRVGLAYAHRLIGSTRHAPFDVTASAGLAVDTFMVEEGGDIDDRGRLSPYLAVDVGIWQGGNFGLLFHAAQSLAVNATGSTSSVTDLAGLVRLDINERISIYTGYRLLLVELRDYDTRFSHEGSRKSFDDELAGPLVGLEFRF